MLLLPDLNPDCSKTREEGHFVESKGLRRVNDFFLCKVFSIEIRWELHSE